jgi:UDP-N-acetylglucosamine/UDP-N-acetylgalactosamine diphosphorylase
MAMPKNGFIGFQKIQQTKYAMNEVFEEEGAIKEAFSSIGQDQVFRFWKELNLREKEYLLQSLKEISTEECETAWNDMQADQTRVTKPETPNFIEAINPICTSLKKYRERGEDLLSLGRVAAFTVAGGQGTRLGHSGPKGTYICTPLQKISLFEHFAKSLKFFSQRYGKQPWWFIMTSQENHEETLKFFSGMNFFGLERERVKFFKQGMMPVFDLQGKILLKEKHQILMSPNGHGGSFRALLDSGALKIMEAEGIDYISYFQVDNPMVYCLDPAFIGLHQYEKSEMSSKAVQKINANERVGTLLKLNNQLHVVEYSDIPTKISEERAQDGTLRFRLGSIAIHLLNRNFVQRVAEARKSKTNRLIYHGALKAVHHIDATGNQMKSSTPNALKAETFVFDALPLAENPLVLEIERSEEFAPIKNASGSDSLESSHELQLARAQKWLKPFYPQTVPQKVEISASFAPTMPHFVEKMSTNQPQTNFNSNQNILFDELGPSIR